MGNALWFIAGVTAGFVYHRVRRIEHRVNDSINGVVNTCTTRVNETFTKFRNRFRSFHEECES